VTPRETKRGNQWEVFQKKGAKKERERERERGNILTYLLHGAESFMRS
jgi:hypothetical protein